MNKHLMTFTALVALLSRFIIYFTLANLICTLSPIHGIIILVAGVSLYISRSVLFSQLTKLEGKQ